MTSEEEMNSMSGIRGDTLVRSVGFVRNGFFNALVYMCLGLNEREDGGGENLDIRFLVLLKGCSHDEIT